MPKKDNEHGQIDKPSTMELPMQPLLHEPGRDSVLMTVKVHVEPKALSQELSARVQHVAKLVGDQINASLRANIEATGKDGVRFDIQVQDKGIALNGISVHSQGNVITVTMRTVEGALSPTRSIPLPPRWRQPVHALSQESHRDCRPRGRRGQGPQAHEKRQRR